MGICLLCGKKSWLNGDGLCTNCAKSAEESENVKHSYPIKKSPNDKANQYATFNDQDTFQSKTQREEFEVQNYVKSKVPIGKIIRESDRWHVGFKVTGIIALIVGIISGIFSFNLGIILGAIGTFGMMFLFAYVSAAAGKILELLNDIKNK